MWFREQLRRVFVPKTGRYERKKFSFQAVKVFLIFLSNVNRISYIVNIRIVSSINNSTTVIGAMPLREDEFPCVDRVENKVEIKAAYPIITQKYVVVSYVAFL